MLSDVWQILRASFNKRLYLYYAVVTCFTMFGSIPIVQLKFPFLYAYIPMASLFLIILSRNFLYPNFKFILLSRKGVKLPVSNQFKQLAGRMNTPLEEIRIIATNEKNAFATRNGIAFTKGLWDELSHGEIMAVAAHELGHKKGRHVIYRFLVMLGVMAAVIVEWSRFTSPILLNETITQILFTAMMNVSLLAFLVVVMIPLSWIAELKADEAAARFAGKENIRSALLKLTKPEQTGQPCETHPSIQERIKRIEKMKI